MKFNFFFAYFDIKKLEKFKIKFLEILKIEISKKFSIYRDRTIKRRGGLKEGYLNSIYLFLHYTFFI